MGDRVVLVDFMHNAHLCMAVPPMHWDYKSPDGSFLRVDTTMPSVTIKKFWAMSEYGKYPIGICFEGGNHFRREYFSKQGGTDASKAGYKAGRKEQNNTFFNNCNMTASIINQLGMSCYRVSGYEADDCIASLVYKIRREMPDVYIDVITNDKDMLPLMDEKTSIYMRSTRTFALSDSPKYNLYYQVTPDTFADYVESTSELKGFYIPHGSILLYKLIRGDKADSISPSITGYGAKKYSALMERMTRDEVDFGVFKYDRDFAEMREVLERYFESDVVDRMEFIFNGIKPRYVELNIPKICNLVEKDEYLFRSYGIRIKYGRHGGKV